MRKSIILYHGSKAIIEKPIFGFGNPHNDYGLGFYCTEELSLAKEWAVSEGQDGYVNEYVLNASDLTCLDLSSSSFNVLHWITILIKNRVFTLKNDIAKAGKEYLLARFSLPYEEYDIIKGYRADDSYFAYAEAFLNNSISTQRLSWALRLGDLGEQIVLKSEKAFAQLNFSSSVLSQAEVYYPLRKERNQKARLAFLSDKQGPFDPNALYLVDIIRGKIKDDDPRLR